MNTNVNALFVEITSSPTPADFLTANGNTRELLRGESPEKKSCGWQNVEPDVYHTFEDMEQLSWSSL
ncbi:3537_t:CDS:1, partial [Acaulospora morrowiae]